MIDANGRCQTSDTERQKNLDRRFNAVKEMICTSSRSDMNSSVATRLPSDATTEPALKSRPKFNRR